MEGAARDYCVACACNLQGATPAILALRNLRGRAQRYGATVDLPSTVLATAVFVGGAFAAASALGLFGSSDCLSIPFVYFFFTGLSGMCLFATLTVALYWQQQRHRVLAPRPARMRAHAERRALVLLACVTILPDTVCSLLFALWQTTALYGLTLNLLAALYALAQCVVALWFIYTTWQVRTDIFRPIVCNDADDSHIRGDLAQLSSRLAASGGTMLIFIAGCCVGVAAGFQRLMVFAMLLLTGVGKHLTFYFQVRCQGWGRCREVRLALSLGGFRREGRASLFH